MKNPRTVLASLPLVVCILSSTLFAGPFDWWSTKEDSFPGARQKYRGGKVWPPTPRPCGPMEPLVHQYHTAHYWPDPYRWQDRAEIHSRLALQANAGWIEATTLFDQHFDEETQEINDAGRVHLRWILLHAPENRRLTWVQAGTSSPASQVRLASVQQEATQMVGATCPPVMLRVCQPTSTAAQDIDMIRRQYLTTMPAPRIPWVSQSQGSGSMTAGSGSAAQQPSTGGR